MLSHPFTGAITIVESVQNPSANIAGKIFASNPLVNKLYQLVLLRKLYIINHSEILFPF